MRPGRREPRHQSSECETILYEYEDWVNTFEIRREYRFHVLWVGSEITLISKQFKCHVRSDLVEILGLKQ